MVKLYDKSQLLSLRSKNCIFIDFLLLGDLKTGGLGDITMMTSTDGNKIRRCLGMSHLNPTEIRGPNEFSLPIWT